MSDPPSPLIPLLFVFDNTHHRITREISQTLPKFLQNLIYNSTLPLSFETFPEDIYTNPSFVNITTLTYTTSTLILLLKLLMTFHSLLLSLLP